MPHRPASAAILACALVQFVLGASGLVCADADAAMHDGAHAAEAYSAPISTGHEGHQPVPERPRESGPVPGSCCEALHACAPMFAVSSAVVDAASADVNVNVPTVAAARPSALRAPPELPPPR